MIAERLAPPPELAPWVVSTEHFRVKEVEGGDRSLGLFLFRDEERTVTIPGSFDPARFNQVVLTVTCQFRSSVSASLARADGTRVATEPLLVRVSSKPQRIVAPFAGNARESRPFERLELTFARGAGPLCVHAVELVAVPPERWVEGSEQDALVRLGEKSRRASLLSRGRPLVATIEPRADEELVFSYGLEPEMRLPGQSPAVELLITPRRGEPRTSRLELESDPERPAGWHSARIEVAGFAPGPVELRFRLAARGEDEAFAWIGEPLLVHAGARAPTVLLVTSDTHRGDHLGFLLEGEELRTPALDALAARGVCFENAFSSAETTLPSHAAILSGHPPRHTRVLKNFTSLDAGVRTLAEHFHDAGWRTFAAVSARHLSDDISGLGQGFERFAHSPGESPAELAVARALEWLAETEGQPVFFWLHLFDAHTPYEAPEEVMRPYVAAAERSGAAPGWPLERERIRARYKAEITWLDRQIARVLDLPRVREGVVAFTGDHGEGQGEAGVSFTHEELFACMLRVPLILAWPDAPAGERVGALASNIDLGRTLLDLAGIPAGGYPGRSLPSIHGTQRAEPRPAFALACFGRSASITRGSAHLILHLESHEIGKPEPARTAERHQVELYDLAADPRCERDLAGERREEARRLREALVAWLCTPSAIASGEEVELSSTDREHLAQMGYATEDAGTGRAEWFDPACDCAQCRLWTER